MPSRSKKKLRYHQHCSKRSFFWLQAGWNLREIRFRRRRQKSNSRSERAMVWWQTSLCCFHIGRNHAGTPVARSFRPIASASMRGPHWIFSLWLNRYKTSFNYSFECALLFPFGDFDVCVRRADLEYLTVAGKVESARCTGRFHCKYLSDVFTRSLFSITLSTLDYEEREWNTFVCLHLGHRTCKIVIWAWEVPVVAFIVVLKLLTLGAGFRDLIFAPKLTSTKKNMFY